MIKKALIPAAGLGTRFLPATKAMAKEMLPIVDKPTLQYIVEEAINSGVEEIIIVTNERKAEIKSHFANNTDLVNHLRKNNKDELADIVESTNNMCKLTFVIQKEQKGLGHAILIAKDKIGNDHFAVLLGDDLMMSKTPVLKQCIDEFEKKNQSSIIGVQTVSDDVLHKYGVVDIDDNNKLNGIVEKPKTLKEAPSKKAALGRYVFNNDIFKYLSKIKEVSGQEIQLTDAILAEAKESSVYAYEFEGRRYDIGSKEGFIEATIDFALQRDELKDKVMEMLKTKCKS